MEKTVLVTCPTCLKTRTLKDRGRGPLINCPSCSTRNAKLLNNWNKTHGESKTPLYQVWNAMKVRCVTVNSTNWKDYGARGIRLCDEWMNWENFRDWALLSGYEKGKLLDRINNNGNYEPSNCRWASSAVSGQNRRSTVLNEKLVSNIRELAKQGFNHSDMALVFGVKLKTLRSAIYGEAWKNIPVPTL